jgi:ABC-2 type transport system ATP-binding protein
MSIISVNNLKKTFGRSVDQRVVALDGISFDVEEGSIVGFLGPNGAGKSTTIKIMLQLLYADAGTVEIFGRNVSEELIKIKRRIGIIPDADLPNLRGERLLRHSARFSDLSGQQLHKRVNEVIQTVGAKSFVQRKTHTMSKGQRQRIKIANALVNDPELIIADEPTAGLDPVSRRSFLNLIDDLVHKEGKTIFFSNHVISEVEKICDKLIILSKGNIVIQGTLTEIMAELPVSNTYSLTAFGVGEEEISRMPDVIKAEKIRNGVIEIKTDNDKGTPEFLKLLVNDPKVQIQSFNRGNLDLEEIFMEVVK